MNIRATLIAAVMLALAGGCSPSSGERATAADRTAHSSMADQPPALPPSPPEDKKAVTAPLPVAVRALPRDKAIAPVEGEPLPQAKLPDIHNMAAAVIPPQPYHPLDLPPSTQGSQLAPFPQEVTNFMVERDSCDHFRGEEPYDADRRAYLMENIAELCTGTDGRLAALRMRYANDSAVLAALSGYEDRIESGSGSGKYIGK